MPPLAGTKTGSEFLRLISAPEQFRLSVPRIRWNPARSHKCAASSGCCLLGGPQIYENFSSGVAWCWTSFRIFVRKVACCYKFIITFSRFLWSKTRVACPISIQQRGLPFGMRLVLLQYLTAWQYQIHLRTDGTSQPGSLCQAKNIVFGNGKYNPYSPCSLRLHRISEGCNMFHLIVLAVTQGKSPHVARHDPRIHFIGD